MSASVFNFPKKPTTVDEQVDLLESRGIIIGDRATAVRYLSRISYYRLVGYLLPFKIGDDLYSPVTFKMLTGLLSFDQQIRSLILKYAEHVEISLRTFVVSAFTSIPGCDGFEYLDYGIFINKYKHARMMETIELEKRRSKELFVKHYNKKYHGNMPIWVAIEMLTFGQLVIFYGNMHRFLRYTVAQQYQQGIPAKTLDALIDSFRDLRNRCAHFGRLYFWDFTGYMNEKWCVERDISQGNTGLFTQFLVMKELCVDPVIWKITMTELEKIMTTAKNTITLSHIQFPENWKEILEG